MKLYLAAPYRYAPLMLEHVTTLAASGHTVTSRWHHAPSYALDADILAAGNEAQAARWALLDLEDIAAADWLLLFTDALPLSRGGRHFETGYAHALGTRIAVLGAVEILFHRLPGVCRHQDLAAWLAVHQEVPHA